jgi:hypothetical protein
MEKLKSIIFLFCTFIAIEVQAVPVTIEINFDENYYSDPFIYWNLQPNITDNIRLKLTYESSAIAFDRVRNDYYFNNAITQIELSSRHFNEVFNLEVGDSFSWVDNPDSGSTTTAYAFEIPGVNNGNTGIAFNLYLVDYVGGDLLGDHFPLASNFSMPTSIELSGYLNIYDTPHYSPYYFFGYNSGGLQISLSDLNVYSENASISEPSIIALLGLGLGGLGFTRRKRISGATS